MDRPTALLTSLVAIAALAWPAAVDAQVRTRGGTSSDSSSSDSGGEPPSAPSEAPRVAVPRNPARVAPSSDRPSSPTVGRSSSGAPQASSPQTTGGTVRRQTDVRRDLASGGDTSTRTRDARAIEGTARARGDAPDPDRWWYPVFVHRVGAPFGYGAYRFDPWRYGLNSWMRQRYGGWYPAYWYGYWSYPYAYGLGSSRGGDPVDRVEGEVDDGVEYGALRLRIDPKSARVYVDGALAGVVDEFDGLSDHLELTAGIHQIELRAEGYEPYVMDVQVEANRTRTARASLRAVE